MSRFDRRLGTGPYAKSNNSSTGRRYSPRPGTADCKLPSRNDVIMSSPIQNKVLSSQTVSNNDNNRTNMLINNISMKNEKIMQKLKTTTNQSEKILLNHEMRLNTVELNVDCLNNLKTENEQRKMKEQIEKYEIKVDTLEKNLKDLGDKMILLTQMIQEREIEERKVTLKKKNKVTLDINDIEKEVSMKVDNTTNANETTDDGPHFE